MADQPVTYHLGQRLPCRRSMGRRQQVNEAQHAGDLRRTRPASTSLAVLAALFPTLRGLGQRRWHRGLTELQQQRSDSVQQRVSTQERGGFVGARSLGRMAEKR